MKMFLSPVNLALFLSLCCYIAEAIPIENGVDGDAEVECGGDSVTMNFNTQNEFLGSLFVKGLYGNDGCSVKAAGGKSIGMSLPFSSCNVQRVRSLEPRGVFVTTTIIISFHPKFITKVDRALKIQCFYMEADKTVSQDLEVSPLTTGLQTAIAPMPACRYDILDGGPDGQPIKYALVGQAVYHKFTCGTDTVDTFCMTVHSCFVTDGQADRADLLNADGCAIDKYLLRNLEYPADLMGGQETHVFKFADRPVLQFQCQVSVTTKDPETGCVRPVCPELRRLAKRTVHQPYEVLGTVDVVANMDVLDLEDSINNELVLPIKQLENSDRMLIEQTASTGFCLSKTGLIVFGLVMLLGVATAGSCLAVFISRRKRL